VQILLKILFKCSFFEIASFFSSSCVSVTITKNNSTTATGYSFDDVCWGQLVGVQDTVNPLKNSCSRPARLPATAERSLFEAAAVAGPERVTGAGQTAKAGSQAAPHHVTPASVKFIQVQICFF
jgi:hypothetical protein